MVKESPDATADPSLAVSAMYCADSAMVSLTSGDTHCAYWLLLLKGAEYYYSYSSKSSRWK